MAIDSVKLTAAAKPIIFNGKELLGSPLTDKQESELNQWVRAQHVQIAALACKDYPDLFDRVVSLALNESHLMVWSVGKGHDLIRTMDGVLQLAYQTFKKKHPAINCEDLRELFKQETGDFWDGANKFLVDFIDLNKVETKNSVAPPEGSEPPTA